MRALEEKEPVGPAAAGVRGAAGVVAAAGATTLGPALPLEAGNREVGEGMLHTFRHSGKGLAQTPSAAAAAAAAADGESSTEARRWAGGEGGEEGQEEQAVAAETEPAAAHKDVLNFAVRRLENSGRHHKARKGSLPLEWPDRPAAAAVSEVFSVLVPRFSGPSRHCHERRCIRRHFPSQQFRLLHLVCPRCRGK